MKEKRNLVAIMFTDIVGYTAIMSKDEKKALLILKKKREILKPLINEYNGEFLKEIGDGTLSSFNSAVDAVNCSIEIQKIIKKDLEFNIRIGIHIGDIVISEGDIFGDGVNVASRIEPLAEPGCICISEPVYDAIRNKPDIKTVFIGEKKLKNVGRPVKVYAIADEEMRKKIKKKIAKEKPAETKKVEEPKKKYKKLAVPIVIILLLAVAFVIFGPFLFDEGLVSEPTPIAVISFENQTGDPNLDRLRKVIPNLLITSLEQSHYLRVNTWQRMNDLLKQMGKENVEFIDEELGFDLCRKDGIHAVVIGSFTQMGDIFATDVKVLDVRTKKIIRSVSSQGEGVESILKTQIDELSTEISKGIKIPISIIEKEQRPIADVTTNSMDAYYYYMRGREEYRKLYYDDAGKFLEKAVELDSTFASAYNTLGAVYNDFGNTKARNEALEKAMNFSYKATEKERLFIEARYAGRIEKDQEKRFLILNQLAEKYPKDKRVHSALGYYYYWTKKMYSQAIKEFNKELELDPKSTDALNMIAYSYAGLEDYEKSIEYFTKYASVSQGEANPLDSMGETYFFMGKLDDAILKYKEALEIKPDFRSASWGIGYIYALMEDYTEATVWVDQFIALAPSQGTRAQGQMWKCFIYNWLGSLDKALTEIIRAVELWKTVGNESWIASADLLKGYIYYDRGKIELARMYFKSWFDFRIENYPANIPLYKAYYSFYIGLVDLKEGQIDSAKSRLTEMKSVLSDIDPANRYIPFYYDFLHGEILLAEGSLEKAITICEKASFLVKSPTMFISNMLFYNNPFLKDALARAYQQKGDINKAITEYERLITFDPESKDRRLIHPLYHYRLAKLYEDKGENDKALREYEKFLEFWKDADEELPQPHDARKRLARLRGAN